MTVYITGLVFVGPQAVFAVYIEVIIVIVYIPLYIAYLKYIHHYLVFTLRIIVSNPKS